MIYGTTTFNTESGSIKIRKTKSQRVDHYPGTDIARFADLGRSPTVITCTIICVGDTERITIEQLLHDSQKLTLTIKNFYYKNVVTGESADAAPYIPDLGIWYINAEFIALDPIPYNLSTEVALY